MAHMNHSAPSSMLQNNLKYSYSALGMRFPAAQLVKPTFVLLKRKIINGMSGRRKTMHLLAELFYRNKAIAIQFNPSHFNFQYFNY